MNDEHLILFLLCFLTLEYKANEWLKWALHAPAAC